jgi:DNA (cytosine-5)-methyltransferase 1
VKVLSLFSGIGGFDLGFKQAGMEVVGMCEIDEKAQSVLRRQFPEAVLHTNVKEVRYERGTVDVICGGFPCQDLSIAGKRRGLDGDRSGLWFEFQRIIDVAEPAWVVIENVPGLLSSARGTDFAVIIQWLAQRGYGVGWRVLDSQGFGLAQRRKRVFIVGSFGTPHGCALLLESESVCRDSASGKREREDSSRATMVGPARKSKRDNQKETVDTSLLPTVSYSAQAISPALRADARQSLMNNFGYICSPLAVSVLNTEANQILWEASHGYDPARVSTNQNIVPTLSAKMSTDGNNVPLVGARRLTPVECERLQGFPDNWTAGQADFHRYKQLGNAVSVPVAKWIGERIMKVTQL